ncbi:uncharacterized protein MAM_01146 [Metarhizium album ARSEF 1941]|uniref:Uncharacterized protein n=1 Tax=Metarhizium album (strain ARSEF 1941) TaxID=1081103 RepID=A0A0B2X3Q2_METAS|nr:uncharacterized protein MAM_01146 [Metarhizium album ARSEF 1941]KHO00368.1 hypothetical protein MAM_01146 [Metarhizium album ARSEF 1941]
MFNVASGGDQNSVVSGVGCVVAVAGGHAVAVDCTCVLRSWDVGTLSWFLVLQQGRRPSPRTQTLDGQGYRRGLGERFLIDDAGKPRLVELRDEVDNRLPAG